MSHRFTKEYARLYNKSRRPTDQRPHVDTFNSYQVIFFLIPTADFETPSPETMSRDANEVRGVSEVTQRKILTAVQRFANSRTGVTEFFLLWPF